LWAGAMWWRKIQSQPKVKPFLRHCFT
jgi:hypothetical protein